MIIIKKEISFVIPLLLMAIFFTTSVHAYSNSSCPTCAVAYEGCGPCGVVGAPPNLPADATLVNPYINYMARQEAHCCRPGYFSGFFLGTGFGAGGISYHLQINNVTPDLEANSRSFLMTRFDGGYIFVWDYFFLGADVAYVYRSRTNPITVRNGVAVVTVDPLTGIFAASRPCKTTIDINAQHGLTADLMPGFVICQFAAFLRLGIDNTSFSWTRRVCFPEASFVVNPSFPVFEGLGLDQPFVDSQRGSITGYRLGAGFAVAVGPHVSFNFNYVHTFFNNISFTPNAAAILANTPVVSTGNPTTTVFTNIDQLTRSNVIKPQLDEVFVGVAFRF